MKQPSSYPWMAALPTAWVVGAATIGPVGKWGKAPGTNGSVVGLLLYTVVFHGQPLWAQVLMAVGLALAAIVICDEAERRLFKRDPGEIILDEVVAMPLVFLGLSETLNLAGHIWIFMVIGFLLFRIFDILKPFGIARLQRLPGGQGVVVDDLAAGIASALVLRIIIWSLITIEVIILPAS